MNRAHGILLVGCGLQAAFAASVAGAEPVPVTRAAVALFPAPGANNVCPDTPLRITFADVPQVGSGQVRVVESARE